MIPGTNKCSTCALAKLLLAPTCSLSDKKHHIYVVKYRSQCVGACIRMALIASNIVVLGLGYQARATTPPSCVLFTLNQARSHDDMPMTMLYTFLLEHADQPREHPGQRSGGPLPEDSGGHERHPRPRRRLGPYPGAGSRRPAAFQGGGCGRRRAGVPLVGVRGGGEPDSG